MAKDLEEGMNYGPFQVIKKGDKWIIRDCRQPTKNTRGVILRSYDYETDAHLKALHLWDGLRTEMVRNMPWKSICEAKGVDKVYIPMGAKGDRK